MPQDSLYKNNIRLSLEISYCGIILHKVYPKRHPRKYMKHLFLLWSLIPVGIITVLLSSNSISVISSTPENNLVFQQAQGSLEQNQKQLATVSTQPVPNA